MASKKGQVIACRFQPGKKSHWLVSLDSSWGLPGEPESLTVLEDLYKHLGVGVKPTPGSLGKQSMRHVYDLYNLKNHTCLPLSCEKFLQLNGFGGIVVTNKIGHVVPIALQEDKSMAYVSKWDIHPDGTPVFFSHPDGINQFVTWFASVKIEIRETLPLGVFPVRYKNGRVSYPTKRGTYYTHVWKEDAELAMSSGCIVQVRDGWGWHKMTRDNQKWAEWIYIKRQNATYKMLEKMVKKTAVAAIGSLGRSRDVFKVVGPDLKDIDNDVPVMIGEEAVDLWIHQEYDGRSSILNHWNDYTVSKTNRDVREFALSYAEQGKLVMIDYDSVFSIGESGGKSFMRKDSIDNIMCKPGTWLWRLHHNFKILRNRMWVSDEEPSRYGSLLEKVVNN